MLSLHEILKQAKLFKPEKNLDSKTGIIWGGSVMELSQVIINVLCVDMSLGYRCTLCQNSLNATFNICAFLYT